MGKGASLSKCKDLKFRKAAMLERQLNHSFTYKHGMLGLGKTSLRI